MAIINHFVLKNLTFDILHDIKINSPSLRERGISVIELLVSVTVLFLTLSLSVSGFQAFRDRALAADAVRHVTSAFNNARYRSLEENRCVRVRLKSRELIVETKKNGKWGIVQEIPMNTDVEISMNTSPVFYPTGFVTPLCTVFVRTLRSAYKITISIAGRIKTEQIKDIQHVDME